MKHFERGDRDRPGRAAATIDCPWCGSPIRMAPARFTRIRELVCPDCGTATDLAVEPAEAAGRLLSRAA